VPAFVTVLRVPYTVLAPLIAIFCVVGVYSVNYSVLDLWIMLAAGLIGYLVNKIEYPLAPLVLALVLGGPLEIALRQSLKMSQNDVSIFVTRPVSGVIVALALAVIAWPLARRFIGRTSVVPAATT